MPRAEYAFQHAVLAVLPCILPALGGVVCDCVQVALGWQHVTMPFTVTIPMSTALTRMGGKLVGSVYCTDYIGNWKTCRRLGKFHNAGMLLHASYVKMMHSR